MYYNLDGTLSNGVTYTVGKPTHKMKIVSAEELMFLNSQNKITLANGGSRAVQGCTTSFIETGYVYCVYTPYSENCSWQSTGYVSFTTCENDNQQTLIDDMYTGGGGGGSSSGSNSNTISNTEMAEATVVDDGKPKIQNINKYIDCFTDGKIAQSYTMTIYVDQPVPGKSDSYNIVTPGVATNIYNVPTGIVFTRPDGTFFDVGHTFVTFEKNNTDGTNVRQTLGFYPKGFGLSSSGAMEDNSGHGADVSYKINVTEGQFNTALQKVESDFATKRYELTNLYFSEYNCTDAAISWMNAAGANFSNSTSGLFKNTPGSFGQVLRGKQGASVGAQSGALGKGACN